MLGARDEGQDVVVSQIGVHVRPFGVRVGDQLTVNNNLFGDGVEPVSRCESERRTVDVRGKDDAVVAKTDFHDLVYTVRGAKLDVRRLDARGRVRNVDGVFANTLAHGFAACTRTTTFDNGGREVKVLTKGFGNDGGIRQNGRGPFDLQLVTGACGSGSGNNGHNRSSQFDRHVKTPFV